MVNIVQGNVLRFLPSFLLQREQINTAIDILSRILNTGAAKITISAAGQGLSPSPAESLEPATV